MTHNYVDIMSRIYVDSTQQRDGLKYAAYGLSEIDGPTVYELMAAAEGWPETDWLKPWRPKVDAEPPRRPNLDKDSSVEPNEG